VVVVATTARRAAAARSERFSWRTRSAQLITAITLISAAPPMSPVAAETAARKMSTTAKGLRAAAQDRGCAARHRAGCHLVLAQPAQPGLCLALGEAVTRRVEPAQGLERGGRRVFGQAASRQRRFRRIR